MRSIIVGSFIAGFVAGVLFGELAIPPVRAMPGPAILVGRDVVRQTPLGDTGTFAVTCATTATTIAWEDGYIDLRCWNLTATAVYLGGSDVDTTNGRPICTTASCVDVEDVIRTRARFCRVAAGTQVIYCEGGSP